MHAPHPPHPHHPPTPMPATAPASNTCARTCTRAGGGRPPGRQHQRWPAAAAWPPAGPAAGAEGGRGACDGGGLHGQPDGGAPQHAGRGWWRRGGGGAAAASAARCACYPAARTCPPHPCWLMRHVDVGCAQGRLWVLERGRAGAAHAAPMHGHACEHAPGDRPASPPTAGALEAPLPCLPPDDRRHAPGPGRRLPHGPGHRCLARRLAGVRQQHAGPVRASDAASGHGCGHGGCPPCCRHAHAPG